jgi:hypothetical protein
MRHVGDESRRPTVVRHQRLGWHCTGPRHGKTAQPPESHRRPRSCAGLRRRQGAGRRRRLYFFFLVVFFLAGFFLVVFFLAGFFLVVFFLVVFFLVVFFLVVFFFAFFFGAAFFFLGFFLAGGFLAAGVSLNLPLLGTKMSFARAVLSSFVVGSLPYVARMYFLMAWREEPLRSFSAMIAALHISAVVTMVGEGG